MCQFDTVCSLRSTGSSVIAYTIDVEVRHGIVKLVGCEYAIEK
jgi:hypothetical protein